MNVDPAAAPLAQKRINDASAAAKNARQALDEQQSKNREAYEKFHNNLALFSSGTIALSITFLGYLKSLPNRTIVCPKLLMASWIVLLIVLLTALFNSFFYSHYTHFFTVGEYLESLVKKHTATATAMESLEFVNLTLETKQAEQQKLQEVAGIYGGKQKSAKRQERFYFWLWVWCGRVARFAFPIGITMLVLFAIKNM